MPTDKFYAVDRIGRKDAVLIGDAGDEVRVPLAELPANLQEGSVLRVSLSAAGELNWPEARLDEREAERRIREAEDVLRELRRRDPGGDVQL